MALFIFRRDFRIFDNTAFIECCNENDIVYPIFIFTPEQITDNQYKSDRAIQFMLESLQDLEKDIGSITYLYGNYLEVIDDIVSNYSIHSIYTNTDYTPYALKRDKDITMYCIKNKVQFVYKHDVCLLPPGTVKSNSGKMYKRFTFFYKQCLQYSPPDCEHIDISEVTFDVVQSQYVIDLATIYSKLGEISQQNVRGGRHFALQILSDIEKGVFKDYGQKRDIMALHTTQLSAYLKFGCVSVREVYHLLCKIHGKQHDLVKQLYWRDFWYQLTTEYKNILNGSMKKAYDNIEWSRSKKNLKAWKEGKTGFPIVDACMNQLNQTGYMHNRGRMIVASFLVKNLHISWKEGEKYFAQKLIDYDPLVNNGNWQWVAGSGTDSQQYNRIFSPWSQMKRFDSKGIFCIRWLGWKKVALYVDLTKLHDWEKKHKSIREKLKKHGIDYPDMIVDYSKTRSITLDMYKKALGYLD